MARATHIRWSAGTAISFAAAFFKYALAAATLSIFSPSYAVDNAPAFQFKAFSAEYKLKKIGMTLGTAKFSLQETATDTW